MFDDIVVVQSAVSAFNNAALYAPAFLWWGILSLPLLVLVWKFAPMIQTALCLDGKNLNSRGGVLVAALTFLWVVLFGGNYGVLRDEVSVLPFVVATIVFLTSLFVASHRCELPDYKASPQVRFSIIVLVLFALGLSDTHVWWGPCLQIGAFLFGWLIGRVARGTVRPVVGMVLIILTTIVALLMQPEFFRFGQLGNLTLLHLLFVLAIGVCLMAVIALNNIKPHGKIRQSAFVKLKWMMRVVSLLMAILFVLTESVPLFLGVCGSVLLMFVLSVWHAKNLPAKLMERTLATTLLLFGVVTTMPVLSAFGVLYLAVLPRGNFRRDFRALL